MLVDAGWCWLMLNDADWCWLLRALLRAPLWALYSALWFLANWAPDSWTWTCCALFLDAIAPPSTYPCQSVGGSVSDSFRFGDSYRISELCELVILKVWREYLKTFKRRALELVHSTSKPCLYAKLSWKTLVKNFNFRVLPSRGGGLLKLQTSEGRNRNRCMFICFT